MAFLGAALWLASGCTTPPLNEARSPSVSDRLTSAEPNLAFRGFPYEQTLLHTFLAKNFLALGQAPQRTCFCSPPIVQ